MSTPAPGHRAGAPAAGRPTISLALALAVAGPVVTLLALVVQAPSHDQDELPPQPPATSRLTSTQVGCPHSLHGGSQSVVVASGAPGGGRGRIQVTAATRGSRPSPVDLSQGGYAAADAGKDQAIVSATGALAPGLLAARFGRPDAPAAGECVTPVGERWFVGVGAGGDHTSVVELVNPDTGPAVADVSLWSASGRLQPIRSRGLTIDGGRSTRIDLEKVSPFRGDLAIRVTVSRGRVAASVADSYSSDGIHVSTDWVPTAAIPTTSQVLPGLAPAASERSLVLVNPGEDEGRVTLQVIGRRSTFRPSSLGEIRVPAGTTVVKDVGRKLAQAFEGDDSSLLVTSTVPVGVGLHEVVHGDLVQHAGIVGAAGAAGTLVPRRGDSVVVVAPTALTGNFTVEFVGRHSRTTREVIKARTAAVFDVPAGTVAVIVRSPSPYAASLRTLSSSGAALLPLRPLLLQQLEPAVTPVWLTGSGQPGS